MEKIKYQLIAGLEVHIELKTESKMFCSCKADYFGVEPNIQTCPVCLGLPGSLPYPNRKAIEWTVLLGLALGCKVNEFSKFDRKNYFYPDLPKGYQISQYDLPLGIGGVRGKIRIRRVHLEEDTGKLIHKEGETFIDFNRSSVPLVEIVTEPDFTSSDEAGIFLQKLQQMVRYLRISNADMEKGQMRCEPTVNLKITKDGQTYFTPLVELKNINSFRFVRKAIEFEINRQLEEFEKAGEVKKAGNKTTRGWNENKGLTVLQRGKEEAEDYRYLPEPDIPPIHLNKEQIEEIKKQLPELPEQKKDRFVTIYRLPEHFAEILCETRQKADYYERTVSMAKGEGIETKEVANILVNKRLDWEKLTPEEFVEKLVAAKQVAGLSDEEIKTIATSVIAENQSVAETFKKGKVRVLEFLVGQVAKQIKGKVDPNKVRQMLQELLKKA